MCDELTPEPTPEPELTPEEIKFREQMKKRRQLEESRRIERNLEEFYNPEAARARRARERRQIEAISNVFVQGIPYGPLY